MLKCTIPLFEESRLYSIITRVNFPPLHSTLDQEVSLEGMYRELAVFERAL